MADDKTLTIKIKGDPRDAIAAVDAVDARLAGVRDKTIKLTIEKRVIGDLNGLGDAATAASRGYDGLGRSAGHAAASTHEHADAAERANRAMRGTTAESAQAASAMRTFAGESERAGQSVRDLEPAGRSVRQLGVDATATATAAGELAGGFTGVNRAAGRAAAGVKLLEPELGDTIYHVDTATRSIRTTTVGLGDLNWGMGQAASGTHTFGEEARRAGGAAGGGIPPIDDIGTSLGGAGDNAEGAGRSIGRLAGTVGGGISRMGLWGTAVGVAGAEIVGLAAGAVTAGIGLGSVYGVARASMPIMAEGRQTMRAFNQEFHNMAGGAAKEALPLFPALKGEVRGLARELASIGVANIDNVMTGATALTHSTTAAMKQLEPAIPPSIAAVTALGQAFVTSFGNSAPAIGRLANSIVENQQGLTGLFTGVISGAADVATVVTGVAGGLGTAMTEMPGQRVVNRGLGSMLGVTDPDTGQPTPMAKLGRVAGAGAVAGGQVISDIFTGTIGTPEAAAREHAKGDVVAQRWAEFTGAADAPKPPPPPPERPGMPPAAPPGQTGPSTIYRPPTQPPPPDLPQMPGAGALGGPGLRPLGGAWAPDQLAQQMNQVATSTNAASTAQAQFGPTVQQSMTQAGTSAATQAPKVAQQMQEMAAPPPPPPPPPPMPPPTPPPMTPMVRAVQAAAPQMESAGADLGASVTSGTSSGMTVNSEKVITEIRKITKRVIEVAADVLDAHSPSREFFALGQGIPQGLGGGVMDSASVAVLATQRMTGQVVAGAQAQFGAAGGQMGAQFGAQLGGAGPFGGGGLSRYLPQAPTGEAGWGNYATNLNQAADAQARLVQDAGRNQDATRGATTPEQFDRFGYGEVTRKRVEEQQRRHNEEKQRRDQERLTARQSARYRSLYGPMDGVPEDRRAQMEADAWKQRYEQQHPKPPQPPPPPTPQSREGLLGPFAVDRTETEARQVGRSVGQGAAKGVNESSREAERASVEMARKMIEKQKKEHGVSSPATVWRGIASDVGAGMTGGLNGAADAVRGVASDRGLQVGYTFARNIVTGADTVLKKSTVQGISVPQIENEQARAWAGAAGFLGPAGSGAQTWKAPMVTMDAAGATSAAKMPPLDVTFNLDGSPFRRMILDLNDARDSRLIDLIASAR